jgi:predicted transcriptional regulator
MIALQATEPPGSTQLIGLLQVLIAVTILIAVAIVAISLTTLSRPTESSRPPERGGRQDIEEEAGPRRVPALVEKYEVEVLRYLSRAEAVDIQDLLSQLPDSREYVGEAISRLAESGLVEVSSGVVALTEKGRKMLELLREKQWLKDVEKSEE